MGFAAFFTSGGGGGTASVSSLGFIYGIPTLLVGAALAYAELEPVPVTYDGPEAKLEALFERKANEAMRKVREDVTRHRYGDDAHLDTTTKALGLVEPGRPYPILLEVKLGETSKGELSYAMVFNAPEAPFSLWADEKRVRKYETFFWAGHRRREARRRHRAGDERRGTGRLGFEGRGGRGRVLGRGARRAPGAEPGLGLLRGGLSHKQLVYTQK